MSADYKHWNRRHLSGFFYANPHRRYWAEVSTNPGAQLLIVGLKGDRLSCVPWAWPYEIDDGHAQKVWAATLCVAEFDPEIGRICMRLGIVRPSHTHYIDPMIGDVRGRQLFLELEQLAKRDPSRVANDEWYTTPHHTIRQLGGIQ